MNSGIERIEIRSIGPMGRPLVAIIMHYAGMFRDREDEYACELIGQYVAMYRAGHPGIPVHDARILVMYAPAIQQRMDTAINRGTLGRGAPSDTYIRYTGTIEYWHRAPGLMCKICTVYIWPYNVPRHPDDSRHLQALAALNRQAMAVLTLIPCGTSDIDA